MATSSPPEDKPSMSPALGIISCVNLDIYWLITKMYSIWAFPNAQEVRQTVFTWRPVWYFQSPIADKRQLPHRYPINEAVLSHVEIACSRECFE